MNGYIVKIIEKNNIKYKRLKYIESTGTQYIKLGNSIKFNTDNTVIEADFQYTQIASDSQAKWLYSCQLNSGNITDFYSQVNTGGNTGFHSRPTGSGTTSGAVVFSHDTNKHHLKIDYINKKVYFDESIVSLGSGQSSQTAPLFLFRRSNADTGYAKIKLFNFKYTRIQHDNDFDLIPVERISDGVIGLLDLLSGTFYTNTGSGTFIKGDYIKVEHIYKMPLITKDGEEVVKVDYIESTDRNHFYINTGYVPNQNSKIIYDFEVTNWGGASSGGYTNQYGALFGKRTENHNTDSWVICRNAGNNSMRCEIGNGNYGITPTFALNTRHKVISEYNKITFDTTEINIGGTAKTYSNLELFLFAINHNGAPDVVYNSMLQKLYDAEIYEGTELIRHFIPVKYGNEYCMLDLVENKLYHNKGTGVFSGGNRTEVTKIKNMNTGKEIIMGGD